jgi:hypothetical protein
MPALRHGSKSGYEGGCRCEKCKAWNAEKQRKYRESKTATTRPATAPRTPRSPAGSTSGSKPPARILGPVEKALELQFKEAGATANPWAATLQAAALRLAKALDEADATLAPRIYPQLLDALNRIGLPEAHPNPQQDPETLPGTAPGAADDIPDPVAGIRIQGRGGAAIRDTA